MSHGCSTNSVIPPFLLPKLCSPRSVYEQIRQLQSSPRAGQRSGGLSSGPLAMGGEDLSLVRRV
jgi:hypothetical protein